VSVKNLKKALFLEKIYPNGKLCVTTLTTEKREVGKKYWKH
jgi:hypothetical protein